MKKTLTSYVHAKSIAARSGAAGRAPRLPLQREVIRELSNEYLADVAGGSSTQVHTCSTFNCKEE